MTADGHPGSPPGQDIAVVPPASPPPSRWRRRLLILGASIVGLAVAVTLVFANPPFERPGLTDELAAAAASAASIDGVLDLAAVVSEPWDRLYIFPPYIDGDGIREGLGFDWTPGSLGDRLVFGDFYLLSDELRLIVFVKGERDVAAWAVLNSYASASSVEIVWHSPTDYFDTYRRSDARFVVEGVGPDAWSLSPA